MSAYATTNDVQARMSRSMSPEEIAICSTLLDDAAIMIDCASPNAKADAKKLVSCRMVIRALGDGDGNSVPIGATQGSQSALGYVQSWTMPSGSTNGELYIGKAEKTLLGVGNRIGSHSPVEDLKGLSL